MDWIAALCLSVPLAGGLVVAAWLRARDARALRISVKSGCATLFDEIAVAVKSAADRMAAARQWDAAALNDVIKTVAADLADAHVRAAKYQARAIVARPKASKPGEPSIFERWIARGGDRKPQTVQDAVEWAIGRLRGTEADDPESDNGDEAGARNILAQYAPGLEEQIQAEIVAGK